MLSVFPNLLNWWIVAPVILRAALGLALVYEVRSFKNGNAVIPLIKVISGALLLIGLYTQGAALASAVIFLYELGWRRDPAANDYRLMKLAVAVALLFLGPGLFSLDFPL